MCGAIWMTVALNLNRTLAQVGLTLDAGVLQTAAKVGDELDLMSLAFDQLKIKIASELMPTIVSFGTTFLQIFKNLEPVILATARLLDAVLTPLTSALTIRGLPQQRTTTNIGGATSGDHTWQGAEYWRCWSGCCRA